jgi:crotonobetainyl-CoA:carnitine CoA-transferase CaiB-like acyl-CoA transferase
MTTPAAAPLQDLLVVELSDGIAGAFCAKSLADLGARVIKIEPRAGDRLRGIGPFAGGTPDDEHGSLFLWLNTGKESVSLDIGHSDGEDVLMALLERADVLVLGGQPDPLAAAGIEAAAVMERFPRLVVTRITPFGVEGPHAGWRSDDIVLYAMSGWMHMTGTPDREPLASGGALAETIPGLAAASATLMAIHARGRDGRGQLVDVSQQEVLALVQPYTSVGYSYTGIERPRNGMPFPMTIVPSADGYLGINVLTQAQWEGLCAFTGLVDLLEDERFATPGGRAEHARELTDRFAEWASSHEKATVFHNGQEWRVPFGYVPHISEVRGLEQHVARRFFQAVDHPGAGELVYPSIPYTFDGARPELSRAPLRGEHTQAILRDELGYDEADIVRLAELGAAS